MKKNNANEPVSILFSLFQKLDYRDKDNSGKKKLYGILTAYLFSSTVLSFNFYNTFDGKSFVILTLTSGLFMIAFLVLNEFDTLFLASRSFEVINSLPVTTRQFFTAKFLSAILFLMFFIAAFSIPQMIFFYFYVHSILEVLLYFFTILLFSYFSIGVLIFVYVFALYFFKNKATVILNFLQVCFFVFVFYSSSVSSEVSSRNQGLFRRENILNYGLIKYFPQSFFANAVYEPLYMLLCLVLAITVFCLIYFLLFNKYHLLLERVSSLKKKKGSSRLKFSFDFVNRFIRNVLLRNNYEIASFNLVKYHLLNSRFLRLKYFPVAFIPLVIVIIGMFSDLPNFLFFNKDANADSFFKTAILVISPSITFTLLMSSRLLISNTKISDDISNDTSWIYDSLPIKEKSFVIKGAVKFIYIFFILPVTILMFVLLCFKTDFQIVALNILFISAGIYFINSISLIFDHTYPFTLESSKFNSAAKFIEIIFAIILGVILFLIQIFVFQNIIFVIIIIAVFILVSLLLNRN